MSPSVVLFAGLSISCVFTSVFMKSSHIINTKMQADSTERIWESASTNPLQAHSRETQIKALTEGGINQQNKTKKQTSTCSFIEFQTLFRL